MRSVIHHLVDGIITFDELGNVTTFNPAAERIFGFAAAEVIGQNLKLLMRAPSGSPGDGEISHYLHTKQAEIIDNRSEIVGLRKDGSSFPMDVAVSAFHLGQARFFTGLVRNISERKRAEEVLRASESRFRMLVEGIQDYAVVMLDSTGNIQTWYKAAEVLFGY